MLMVGSLFIGYPLIDIFDSTEDETKTIVAVEGINTDMPNPNVKELKNKYESMVSEFGKVKDYGAIEGVEPDEVKEEQSTSLYTDEEIAELDSLNKLSEQQFKQLKEIEQQLKEASKMDSGSIGNEYGNNPYVRTSNTEEFRKQLEMIEEVTKGKKEETKAEIKPQPEPEEPPAEVKKVDNLNASYFNTVGNEDENINLIKAMVDENLKVVDGSRIRIRLLDDVVINDVMIPKNSYLYALVSGFGAQRVRAKIETILVGDNLIKVDLTIYDIDGIEGFYVPESAFRDLTKELGAGAMNQNISMTTGSQDLEGLLFQTLQNAYQSTSRAIGNAIKKNKANVKYSTQVYLINKSSLK